MRHRRRHSLPPNLSAKILLTVFPAMIGMAPAQWYAPCVRILARTALKAVRLTPDHPAEMLSAVNFSLGERRIDGQFVSLIYAVWDDLNRTLQIANSGLPRPIYCHHGEIEIIEATGLPLGLFDDAEYDEFGFQANTGDLFVFFSDGILDATNSNGDLFGRRGVETIVKENCRLSAQEIVDAIFKAVQEHSAGGEAFDDQTILAIRVKGHSGKRK